MEKDLEEFLARFGSDPRARWVQGYLAWSKVESGDLVQALQLSEALWAGTPGSVADFGTVIRGAVLARSGRAERAVELLAPLRRKIVEPELRSLFCEEIVLAAMAAKRYALAIELMVDWVEQAPDLGRGILRARIAKRLEEIPDSALEEGLVELRRKSQQASDPRSLRPEARRWLQRQVSERLSARALAKGDTQLARRLLTESAREERRAHTQAALAELARKGRVAPRVVGRSLGVVLDISDTEARRRSTELASGIAKALGLPRALKEPGRVRLVTEPARGGGHTVVAALSALAGQGAGILVAGVTPLGATAAAAFAHNEQIPVVLLMPPAEPSTSPFVFVLGTDLDDFKNTVTNKLIASGLEPIAEVGGSLVPCRPESRVRFPTSDWKRDGVRALLVTGDAACASDLASQVARTKLEVTIALGIDAAHVFSELATPGTIYAAAGRFPLTPDDQTLASERSWFAVLGRDAVALAKEAFGALPAKSADDPKTVRSLHVRAATELRNASVPLWSTDRTGFSGEQVMARELVARTYEGTPP